MPDTNSGPERPDADLIRALEESNVHPLWDRYAKVIPVRPSAPDTPMLWRWRDIEPLAARAATEVPLDDKERRALIMAHPAFGGDTVATSNLIGAFTILEPGDRAPMHRHTAPAIRFGVDSDGAATIVNGRRCNMGKGDLVLTPPMCWHGHINGSGKPTVWFDALGSLISNHLDASFFEPGAENPEIWSVDDGDERLWAAAGMVDPAAARGPAASGEPSVAGDPAHSPKFHYPGDQARRLLAAMAPGPDGARTMRYVDPVTGGSVMHMLDCYMTRLDTDAPTRPRRATYNAVCLVTEGRGRSDIGGQTIEWSERDIFTIPHWEWARHEAIGGDADIFIVTDRVVYERLGILREEME